MAARRCIRVIEEGYCDDHYCLVCVAVDSPTAYASSDAWQDAIVASRHASYHAAPEYSGSDRTECCGARFDGPCKVWCVNAS